MPTSSGSHRREAGRGQARAVRPVAGPATGTSRRGQSLPFPCPGPLVDREQRALVLGMVKFTLLSELKLERTSGQLASLYKF